MAGKGSVRDAGRERRWRRVMRSWAKSGVGVREFCRREKLPETAFYYWRRELRRRDGEKKRKGRQSSGAFVPVRLAGDFPVPVELRLVSGQVLRLGAAFDPGRVAELVRLLEG